MLTDIITGLVESQADMVVVGVAEAGADLVSALDDTRPDVVILGLEDAQAAPVSAQALKGRPDLRVIGVSADGRRSSLYELRPCRVPLGELSAQGLVDAIRDRAFRGEVTALENDARSG